MTIDLTPEQERFIKQQLASGNYVDESAVVAHALDLWQRYQQEVEKARAGVQRGIDDIEAGRYREARTPEDTQALAEEVKQRGMELRAKRERNAQ